ncbi:MAG: hypothetical protein IJA08_03815 [Clostridia bacterium]|nr:hypothetical protein [Clostridia bacterium]
MRKGFKVLAAIMVVAMLCTMSLSAFAASHVTETTLENGVYTTTTTVTTDNSGEQVAYLVYKPATAGDAPSTSNIVYIDQKAATGTTATFSFSPDAADAGALIKVGTTSAAASAVTGPAAIELPAALVDVTWSVAGGNGTVALAAADGVTLDESGAKADVALGELTFVVSPEMGYKLATVNDVAASVNANGYYVATVTAEVTNFVFAFEAVAGAAATSAESTAASITYSEAADATNSAFILGSAAGAFTNAGMYFSMDADKLANLGDGSSIPEGVVRVQALKVGSDGKFAIRMIETLTEAPQDYVKFITGSKIYAKSFVKANGVYTFGSEVITIQ